VTLVTTGTLAPAGTGRKQPQGGGKLLTPAAARTSATARTHAVSKWQSGPQGETPATAGTKTTGIEKSAKAGTQEGPGDVIGWGTSNNRDTGKRGGASDSRHASDSKGYKRRYTDASKD
jgi:hypothetical protein